MLSILGFLAVLAPLVIVHEFGHFLFARLFNVKAEVFSIGFGPRIWAKQIGETEWRVAAVPLGGFVKLLGEDGERELTPEEKPRALNRQAPWKRFFIFFGGPLFNFLFAILVYAVILVVGEEQLASVAARVVPGSVAAQAGFRSGDEIRSVDGQPVRKFEDVIIAINENPNRALDFGIERGGATQTLQVKPTPQDGFSIYGEDKLVGEIDGLLPLARSTKVGISNPTSLAGRAGLRTGDRVVSLNGQPVKSWEELEARFDALAPGSEVTFAAERTAVNAAGKPDEKAPPQSLVFKATKPATATAGSLGDDLGLWSSELFVDKPVEKSPAEGAGIRTGDRLVAIGDRVVHSFYELKDNVQKAGEKDGKVPMRWERDGQMINAVLTPTSATSRDPVLRKTTQYTVGVVPMMDLAEPAMVLERVWNPFVLLYRATARMIDFSVKNVVSLAKMFTGDVSLKTLGGPILIGKIAGESITRGLNAFLNTMAALSVGLGVLNVLPIPVLDGGHLLLLGIEAVRRRPLSLRQTEIVQQVGLSLILLLMVIVMRNDLARLALFD